MPIINLSEPLNILIATVVFILVLFLARETKKSGIVCIMLLVFLTIIVGHCIEYVVSQQEQILTILARSILADFIFIFISFISYLWVDDTESKEKKIKSIDNSLDWFWKKV